MAADLSCEEQAPVQVAGQAVRRFRLSNAQGLRIELMAYGATLLSVELLDEQGHWIAVTRGLQSPEQYSHNDAYMGVICGRYAGRIAKGAFELNGKQVQLTRNSGPHHLHGGKNGFNAKLWEAQPFNSGSAVGVQFSYLSADGEEGYPGALQCEVRYSLDTHARLRLDYVASVQGCSTVVNLTNHTYWNLSVQNDIYGHLLQLRAGQILEFNDEILPTGRQIPVAGTAFDFTSAKLVGEQMAQLPGHLPGFDHCYVHERVGENKLTGVARLLDPTSGRQMDVYTDQPAVVLYTGNFLDGSAAMGGHHKHAALCLECQQFPDAPNRPEFPSAVINPGEAYTQTTVYAFSNARS